MSARLLMTCVLAAFGLGAAAPVAAQGTTQVRGWFGGGLGTASAKVNCEMCVGDRNGGFSGYLAGGLRLAPGLDAGAEIDGWFDTTDEVSQRLLLYGASVWWHPQPDGRWFLKGGMGLMRYHAGTDVADDEPLRAGAAALQLGTGYDFRASRRLWFSPYANLLVTTSGNLTSGTTVVTDASFSLLQLGAGLSWR
jgi:hypothetical protein